MKKRMLLMKDLDFTGFENGSTLSDYEVLRRCDVLFNSYGPSDFKHHGSTIMVSIHTYLTLSSFFGDIDFITMSALIHHYSKKYSAILDQDDD